MRISLALAFLSTYAHYTHATQIITSLPLSATSFDYIIVGGGLAGLVLGNRLSGDGRKFSVLVIEAGGDTRGQPLINDPNLFLELEVSSAFSWNWPTVNQTVGGSTKTIAGGKVLGGSTSINGMDWTRGSVEQYDAIENLGNPGWGWNNLQKYMKKAERFNVPTALEASRGASYQASARGFDGLVGSGWPTPYEPFRLFQGFIEACAEVFGIAKGKDLCSGDPNSIELHAFKATQNSFSVHRPGANASAVRSSSAVSYLYPTLADTKNPGLTVLIGHQATKILWKTPATVPATASGVEFASVALPLIKRQLRATKEVIVSAGSIMSPHLLMLSGVGNANDLTAVGVTPVVDLPSVGTGLQDQTLNIFLYSYNTSLLLNSDYANAAGGPAGGALAFPSLKQLLGKKRFASTILDLKRTARARAQAIVDRGAWTNVEGLRKIFLAQASIISGSTPAAEFSQFNSALAPPDLLGAVFWNLLPQTRGTVKLASNNPFQYPLIDPAYLDSTYDLLVQTTAVRAARALFKTPSLASIIGFEISPGEIQLPSDATDAQVEAYVKGSYMPVYHPIGTVAMMPKEMGGSVDPELKLYGTTNVRVVDASIIPFQLSAHLSSTVYGVAEKAADIILASV
ncbi:hypothetical protein P7C70_g8484, partial [Phenoliferia sp. Uapishka_3]